MKILPKSKFWDLKGAINVVPHCSAPIFKINEQTFAFCLEDEKNPYLLVKSLTLGPLLKRLEDRVIHYILYRPECLCCKGYGGLTIRITDIDDINYQIDENDDVEICISIEKVYNNDYEAN